MIAPQNVGVHLNHSGVAMAPEQNRMPDSRLFYSMTADGIN